MRRLRAIFCISLAASTVVPPISSARAQTVPGKEIAKKLFDEGVELERRRDFVAALTKYGEAEQITATPGLRFHKGYCLEMLGKLNAALDEYEAADRLAREASKPDVHAAVLSRLDPLRARVPQIAIRLGTAAKDAEVQLDGEPVSAPLLDGTAFRVEPGEHAVTARAPGYTNFARRTQVPEGTSVSVEIVLDRAPVVPAHPWQAATQRESAPRRALALPVATTVGAGVLVVTGIALVGAAGGAQRDGRALCPQKMNCDREQSTVRTFDALALGCFVGAAGLGALSAVLWTSKGRDRAATLAARAAFSGGSVGFEGAF